MRLRNHLKRWIFFVGARHASPLQTGLFKWRLSLKWGVIVLLGLLVGTAQARDLRQGSQCTIAANETISGSLFALCRTLIVDGRIEGNLFGMAANAIISGAVEGDVYLLAGELDVHGTVGDDVHFAGSQVRLHDSAQMSDRYADLLTLSLSTEILPGAALPGSLSSASYQVRVDGIVGGELHFSGASLAINGRVGGDVDAQVGSSRVDISQWQTPLNLLVEVPLMNPGLRVGDSARLDATLTYTSQTQGEIAAEALANPPIYIPVVPQPDFSQLAGQEAEASGLSIYLTQVARDLIALGVIGVIGLLIAPRPLQTPLETLRLRPLPSLAVGALGFVGLALALAVFILLTILVIALVGTLQSTELTLIVAAILGIVDIGGSGVLLFVMLFLSRVVVCLTLGQLIVQFAAVSRSPGVFVRYLVGVGLLALVSALPIAGTLITWGAIFLGLGAIVLTLQGQVDQRRDTTSRTHTAAAPGDPDASRGAPPPPILDDTPRPVGMDNLPDGFRWWESD